jgi:hypothetical protein
MSKISAAAAIDEETRRRRADLDRAITMRRHCAPGVVVDENSRPIAPRPVWRLGPRPAYAKLVKRAR